jgi:pimeloyl-ACP methyl ester carboxylesterase
MTTIDENLDQCVTALADAASMKRSWYTLDDGLRVHVLTRPGLTDPKKEIVMIHGVISSSILIMHMVAKIPEAYTVHSIDLPGYGISDNLDLPKLPNPVRLLELYADVVAETIRRCSCVGSGGNGFRVHIVGHSFGAMIALYVQLRHPELVGEMTLLKPAGLFPTLNAYGYYYGVAFSLGWAQSILKHIPGIRCCRRLITHPMTRFTLLTLTHPTSNAYMNPAHFITFRERHVIWNTPCIRQLCKVVASGCRVRVFFAEHDPLIPAHQAGLLEALFDGYRYQDAILAGEGHQLESSGYAFLPENAEKGVLLPSERGRRLLEGFDGGGVSDDDIRLYGGTPSLAETEANRLMYYKYIRWGISPPH